MAHLPLVEPISRVLLPTALPARCVKYRQPLDLHTGSRKRTRPSWIADKAARQKPLKRHASCHVQTGPRRGLSGPSNCHAPSHHPSAERVLAPPSAFCAASKHHEHAFLPHERIPQKYAMQCNDPAHFLFAPIIRGSLSCFWGAWPLMSLPARLWGHKHSRVSAVHRQEWPVDMPFSARQQVLHTTLYDPPRMDVEKLVEFEMDTFFLCQGMFFDACHGSSISRLANQGEALPYTLKFPFSHPAVFSTLSM